jgi:hypothetical protein
MSFAEGRRVRPFVLLYEARGELLEIFPAVFPRNNLLILLNKSTKAGRGRKKLKNVQSYDGQKTFRQDSYSFLFPLFPFSPKE